MSTWIYVAFDPYAPKDQMVTTIENLYMDKFRGYGAGQSGAGAASIFQFVPRPYPDYSGPFDGYVYCPQRATPAKVDEFFTAIQQISGVTVTMGFPDFTPINRPVTKTIIDPVSDGQGGYKSNPANWPNDDPDGHATGYGQSVITMTSLINPLWNENLSDPGGFIAAIMANYNMDTLIGRGGSFEPKLPYVSPAVYATDLYNRRWGGGQNLFPKASAEKYIKPWLNKESFMSLEGPFATVTEYDEYEGGTDAYPPIFDWTTYSLYNLPDTPALAVKQLPTQNLVIGDKEFRWKHQGQWYCLEITGNQANIAGVENMYTTDHGKKHLTFGWATRHPFWVPSFFTGTETWDGRRAWPWWMKLNLCIRQGNENAGPKLDVNGVESEQGVASTIVTAYMASYMQGYYTLAEKDMWAI